MKNIYLSLLGLLLSLILCSQIQAVLKANCYFQISNSCAYEQASDTIKYKELEENFREELQKSNISSRAADYMTSDAFRNYKLYVCECPGNINQMFQSFLFQGSVKGLYGHLIDEIVKTRYPDAPSIWIMATNVNNEDDEKGIISEYQSRISQLINEERNRIADSQEGISVSSDQADSRLLWKEANQYRATITDSTFLKTKGVMSDNAIAPFVSGGWNPNYAYNQVIYLKALERAKRHLSVKNNQFVYLLKSGAEINISEDIHQFIRRLFEDWNRWMVQGRFQIIKDADGFYDITPLTP